MSVILLDTNILLRFCNPTSPRHAEVERAVSRLRLRGDLPSITTQNIIEFWAVATRPLDVNGLDWSVQKTANEIDQLLNTFPLLKDSPDILPHWLTLVKAGDSKGKKAHDARLVAAMQAHGVFHLLTFNTEDFKDYPNITLLHPNDVA
jgi:predicted nucleic acid-binding protein